MHNVKIDSGSVASGEFAKFTANGVESRSICELSSDIGAATTDDIIEVKHSFRIKEKINGR